VSKPRPRPTDTIREALCKGTALLHGAPNPFVEAKVLLMAAAGIDEVELFASPDRALTPGQGKRFFRLIDRRLSGRPLAYITGKKEFWSLAFKVIPGVHIPRPETELIVELVLGLSGKPDETIVDIGTGSGNIAVALARELPGARCIREGARSREVQRPAERRGEHHAPAGEPVFSSRKARSRGPMRRHRLEPPVRLRPGLECPPRGGQGL
jgi:hypothetical protein